MEYKFIIAITEHDELHFPDYLRREADRLGILLMCGAEMSVGRAAGSAGPVGKHVLFLNTGECPPRIATMRDLRLYVENEVDRERVLVVGVHPYPRMH